MWVALFSVLAGNLILAFDPPIANAMNQFSIVVGKSSPQFRWRASLPPWSRERFESYLWWVRFWGGLTALQGIVLSLAVFLEPR
jgi:hypothetical protein